MSEQQTIPLIIFVGPVSPSEPERWVGLATRASTIDLVARAIEVPSLRPIVVVACGVDGLEELASLPADLAPDPPGTPFHFGCRLRAVAEEYGFSRLLYIGGGAAPLLTPAALAALAARGAALERGVITNNLYSTDFAALAPAGALATIDLPSTDNDLAWRLRAAGLPVESLPATAATRLDLDTPNDLLLAALHPACGPRLRRYVASLPLDSERLRRIIAEMRKPEGEVLVYGRISATAWQAVEHLPCQTRVFSEERGMRASGRLAAGRVHAWLGAYLARVGPQEFFQSLARSCTAALLDTRPLFAHLGLWPSAHDRFYSDLLQPGAIDEPLVRAFTEAARDAPVPIMLGGQSLVSGGLLALAEMAAGT